MAERSVGGLWCSEVLTRLSDYLDGELSPAEASRVETHLNGCRECDRFGSSMQALLTQARALLGKDEGDRAASVESIVKALEET